MNLVCMDVCGHHRVDHRVVNFACAKMLYVVPCAGRRGAWMFAEMLIHFHFGKFLHYPYVLVLGEVMPNFFVEHACVYACITHMSY